MHREVYMHESRPEQQQTIRVHLLRALEQKGMIPGPTYIRTWYVYQHFLFDFPFDEIYRRLLFFTLTRYVCATPGTYTNIFFLIFRLMTYTDVCFFSLLPDTYVGTTLAITTLCWKG